MKCKEAREKLLDLVEGDLDDGEAQEVRDHLDDCELCREEADCLRAGLNGIRDAVPLQVGTGPHLTPSRRKAALQAARKERKKTRLVTWRKFAGAAAAAMLLVSAWFLAQDLLFTETKPPRRRTAPGRMAQVPPRIPSRSKERAGPVQQVTLNSGDKEPSSAPRRVSRPGDGPPREVMFNQPAEVQVPVQNAYYEPRRERYWW
jgi:predicted anti-sigma-YlaC factor YlaD